MKINKLKMFSVFIILINISCRNTNPEKKLNHLIFDKVEHYHTEKKCPIITQINDKRYKNLSEDENEYLNILESNIPTKMNDTTFVSKLENLNFSKKIIEKSKNKEFEEIFSKEFCDKMAENACSPQYRDIYIFRKDREIIGIAKVCFDCKITYFISNKYSWQSYGNCEKLEKLQKM